MANAQGLNLRAHEKIFGAQQDQRTLCIEFGQLDCGVHVVDFGVHSRGGLNAGLQLASICLGGSSGVSLSSGWSTVWQGPWIQVFTDHPVRECLFGQYAGWPVKSNDFFAMGSGPMRVHRGKEKLLEEFQAKDSSEVAVGVLECDSIPSDSVALEIAEQCNVHPESLWLAVAPVRSIAGCVQVVARSVETSLHKLYELGFPLDAVRHAYGIAPLPPPTPDFALGIGRTNDAILYGGHVSLWVDTDDSTIEKIGPHVPSSASPDFGAPFADIFKRYQFDFYKIDPGLFSPAEVVIHNLRTGRVWRFGTLRADLVAKSFSIEYTE